MPGSHPSVPYVLPSLARSGPRICYKSCAVEHRTVRLWASAHRMPLWIQVAEIAQCLLSESPTPLTRTYKNPDQKLSSGLRLRPGHSRKASKLVAEERPKPSPWHAKERKFWPYGQNEKARASVPHPSSRSHGMHDHHRFNPNRLAPARLVPLLCVCIFFGWPARGSAF